MLVKDIMRLAKIRVNNIAVSRSDEAMLGFINMGVADLYRRFDLRIKSETVITNDDLALYELKSTDVLMLLSLYDRNGRELTQTDVLDSNQYDYKQINYRSFLLRKPFNGYIYTLYKASAIPLKDENDYIDIPDAMIEALLAHIAYSAFSTINRDNMNEFNTYLQRYELACQSLENQGYKISINTERINMITKGFV